MQPCILDRVTNNDTARIEVVVQCASLTQELRAEQDIVTTVFFSCALGKSDRNCRFDDHYGIGIDGNDLLDDALDRTAVKVIFGRVLVGRRGNDDKIGVTVGAVAVGCSLQIEVFGCKIFLDPRSTIGDFLLFSISTFSGMMSTAFTVLCCAKRIAIDRPT